MYGAAVQAELGRAKLAGLMIDKKEIKTGKIDQMDRSEVEARLMALIEKNELAPKVIDPSEVEVIDQEDIEVEDLEAEVEDVEDDVVSDDDLDEEEADEDDDSFWEDDDEDFPDDLEDEAEGEG